MPTDNLSRLRVIAQGLEELNGRVVFVGGSVAQLYASDSASTDIRPTDDIDCVVDLSSYKEYCDFSELLRSKRFHNDATPGAPICRWLFLDEKVDFMPTDSQILGFSNRWYKSGMAHKVVYEISADVFIHILPAIYFIATKFEAVRTRGGADLRTSHDFEDIVYVLNYCPEIAAQFVNADDSELKTYIRECFSDLLSRNNIQEEIECMLPYGEQERSEDLLDLMAAIVKQ